MGCHKHRKVQDLEPCKEHIMKAILLWLVGIPIPVIILLYMFGMVGN